MEPSSALLSGDLVARAQIRITVGISAYHHLSEPEIVSDNLIGMQWTPGAFKRFNHQGDGEV